VVIWFYLSKGAVLSLTKFDFSKFFDLQVLVIESDPAALHLMKQILQGLGIKKLEMSRSVQELLALDTVAPYDVIFLDYHADPAQTGQDMLERIVERQLLKAGSRLVLLSEPNEALRYSLDYPFHQISVIDRPYNKFHIDDELKQHVRLSPLLEPCLALAQKRRYIETFKLINDIQQKAHADMLAVLQPLKVAVLLELGVYDAAAGLIKNASARQQGWALWAQFHIDYELGDVKRCWDFLQNPAEELQKYQDKRELWSVFLAMQQGDYATARQIVSKIPAAGMSLKTSLLVQLVLLASDQAEQAIELIERKRRLLGSGHVYCSLTIHLCWIVLRLLQQGEEPTEAMLNLLNQSFRQLVGDKEMQYFAADVIWLQAAIVQLNSGVDAASEFLERQKTHLATLSMNLPALCQGALLMQALGRHQAAFDLLQRANRQLNQLPHTTARIYYSCLHLHSFNLLYAPEQRAEMYSKLGQRHQQEGELKLAAKMYYSAYQLAPKEPDYQLQLTTLLRQLKLNKFRAFQLPEASSD